VVAGHERSCLVGGHTPPFAAQLRRSRTVPGQSDPRGGLRRIRQATDYQAQIVPDRPPAQARPDRQRPSAACARIHEPSGSCAKRQRRPSSNWTWNIRRRSLRSIRPAPRSSDARPAASSHARRAALPAVSPRRGHRHSSRPPPSQARDHLRFIRPANLGVAKALKGRSSHLSFLPRSRRVTVAWAPPAPATRSTSATWLTSRRPWRELLSGITLPGGATAPADLLAREPQALLVRA
jgi:hypothetical protein